MKENGQERTTTNLVARHPHLAVFLLSCCIQGLYLLDVSRHPGFQLPTIDAATYDSFARNWATHGIRDSTTAWHAALYPLLLALLYKTLGTSIWVAKIVQGLVGAATCAGVSLLASRCWGRNAGLWAGAIASLYGPAVLYNAELMPGGLSIAISTVLTALLIGGPSRPIVRGALHGVVAALAVMTRPELFLGYIGGHVIWFGVRVCRRLPTNVPAALLLGGLATFAALTVPVAFLNKPFSGSLSFLPVNGGLNLYLAHGATSNVFVRPGPDYDRLVNEPKRLGMFTANEQNAYFKERALRFWIETPGEAIKHTARKAHILFAGREYATDIDLYAATEASALLGALLWTAGPVGCPWSLLVPLSLVGMATVSRHSLSRVACVYLVTAAAMIALLPGSRYRLVLLPPLWMLAGAGVVLIVEAVRRRDRNRLTKVLVTLAAGVVVTLGPARSEQESQVARAERYRMIGQRVDQPGTTNGWLDISWQMKPDDSQTAFFLALRAWENDESARALTYLDRAISADPDYVMAHMLRADIRAGADDAHGARMDLEEALRSQPDHVDILIRLARLEAASGRMGAAQHHFEDAARFSPGNPEALSGLAAVLLAQGDAGRAQSILDTLLASDPDNITLHESAAAAADMLYQTPRAQEHRSRAAYLRRSQVGRDGTQP